jgi:acetylornithine deacetylase/succinyl-diaminopimelate desuccinylase-like protein
MHPRACTRFPAKADEELTIDSDHLLRILRKMISINSVLPREADLASFVAEELQSFGVEPEWHEIAPGRPNVYTSVDFGGSHGFLVFSGHSDTVPPASDWESDPFAPLERDGRLYGLGAINMKAGLACMTVAFLTLLREESLHRRLGRVGLAITVDQEGQSLGAEALLDTEYGTCDAMLHAEHFYGDSFADYLPNAATGKILYRLQVRGRAAHALRPHEGGINAIVDASKIVNSLEKLTVRHDPELGTGTVCVLRIEGGYKEYSLVVPERCEIIVNRLTVPGETAEIAVQDMENLVSALDLGSEVSIETPPPRYEPYRLDMSLPFVEVFQDVYRRVVGTHPHFGPHRGIVDANVFVAEGNIPTIVFGPKGANHHQSGEYVELRTLEPTARVYAETALEFFCTV